MLENLSGWSPAQGVYVFKNGRFGMSSYLKDELEEKWFQQPIKTRLCENLLAFLVTLYTDNVSGHQARTWLQRTII